MIIFALSLIFWLFIWLLLSWPPDVQDVITGFIVAIIVTLMVHDMPAEGKKRVKSPYRCLWFIYYLAVFIWECIKANFDVAYRVIHPDLPIRPATVRFRTNLKSDLGITFLANSITLTPGTTTVDIDRKRGYIYIHRLYVGARGQGPEARETQKNTAAKGEDLPVLGKFERILERIFE